MTDVVERVARALSVADGMHPEATSNDEDEVPVWTLYVDDAKTALAACDYAILEYVDGRPTMTKDEFINVVLGAADDQRVVRAMSTSPSDEPKGSEGR